MASTTEQTPAPAPQAPPRRKPPVVAIAVVTVLLAVGGVFGVRWWLHKQAYVSTEDAQVAGDIVIASARVAGHLATIATDEGQAVKAGEPLFRLDAADFEAQLAQAEAALAVARSNLKASEVGVRYQEDTTGSQIVQAGAALEAARANVVSAAAAASKARADLGRLEALFRAGGVSRQAYDAARTAATSAAGAETVARSQLRQAEAGRAQAQAGLESVVIKEAGVQTVRAQIAQAEAAVAQARLNLAHATVLAPTDGIVVRRAANPGEQVTPGQAVVSIARTKPVWIQAYVEETQIRRVRPGAPVEVEIDAYPGVRFEGHVGTVGAVTGSQFSLMPANNASGNFTKVVQRLPVRIEVEDPAARLRPGMSAVIEIAAGS